MSGALCLGRAIPHRSGTAFLVTCRCSYPHGIRAVMGIRGWGVDTSRSSTRVPRRYMTENCACVERRGTVYDKEALSGDAKGRQWASHGKRMKVKEAGSSMN